MNNKYLFLVILSVSILLFISACEESGTDGSAVKSPMLKDIAESIEEAISSSSSESRLDGNETNPSCTDSDNGLVVDVYGHVYGYSDIANGSAWFDNYDICSDNIRVREFFCNGTSKNSRVMYCPGFGYNSCENGVCVTETNQTTETHTECFDYHCVEVMGPGDNECISDFNCPLNYTCVDTDGGLNYEVKGTVYGSNSSGPFTFSDVCSLGGYRLNEYSCGNFTYSMQYIICEDIGYLWCENGACVSNQTMTCNNLGGRICAPYGNCYGEQVEASDGMCCLGTCRKSFWKEFFAIFIPS